MSDGASGRHTAIVNAMTVDVEDYFQVSAFDRVVSRASWDSIDGRVVQNTRRLLELFDRVGVHATFFVLGWVADRHPSLVREIVAGGHEVASHGYHHQMLYVLTPAQFREDIRSARKAIENATGTPVLGFRAPSYSVIASSLWALDILVEEGYAYDTSIFPIHHDRYGIPDAPRHIHRIERTAGTLIEVPASTVRLGGINLPIGGGGYFRLLPYAWTRWGIARVNRRERQPAVFYLHPWEVDPDQPRFRVGAATRVRHYAGLSRTIRRLERLLEDFRFAPIASVLSLEPASAARRAPAEPTFFLAAQG